MKKNEALILLKQKLNAKKFSWPLPSIFMILAAGIEHIHTINDRIVPIPDTGYVFQQYILAAVGRTGS